MSPETWKKVKSVFNEASELPKDQRLSFLSQLEEEIQFEVEKMLKAVDEESLLLNEPIVNLNDFEEAEIPIQIADYKIIREIGHGGMGTVYEAIRETENFKQHVALKVIKRGMNNEIILKRFRAEQQILASLEHQNIGRFLDGGKTSDGLPFYTMEFIEGLPIDEYCRKNNLSISEKVRLFREVCSTVSYAHTNLIVHRDLKPSNIIVTSNEIPKLLDFGIAKVLDVESTELGTATQLGMMTPQYASPEQIRGEKVTTLSDLYSLGIILYEILTNQKPYLTENKNYAEILEIVTKTELLKPSETPDSKLLIPKLKGDLDTIVLKALQKQPERRYQSVEQFSEDLRRHLEGLPITARPDTFSYRLSKFVERNKIGVGAGIIVFLSLLAGISVASWQAYRAEKQRLLAETRFAEVRTIANNFVFKYHDEIEKLNGSTAVREMLVKDATLYLDKLAKDAEGDTDLQNELALAYLKLGDVQGKTYSANIGDSEGASASYQKALNLMENVVVTKPNDIVAKDDLIKIIDAISSIQTRINVKSAEKVALLDKSSKLLEEIIKIEPKNIKRLTQLSMLYIRYGDSVGQIKNKDSLIQKLEYHQKALQISTELFQIEPNKTEHLRLLARANQRIGTDFIWLGENAEINSNLEESKSYFVQALPFHKKMFEIIEKLYEIIPQDISLNRNRIATHTSYAETLSLNGKNQEALELIDKAMDLAKKNQASDAHNKEANFDVALAYAHYAKVFGNSNEVEKSIENYKKALKICEEIFSADNKNIESFNLIKQYVEVLVKIYKTQNNPKELEFYQKRSLQLDELNRKIKQNPTS